jgi:UPF0755 protein
MAKKKVVKPRKPAKEKPINVGFNLKAAIVITLSLGVFLFYKIIFEENTAFRSARLYYLVKKDISIHKLADSLKSDGVIDNAFVLRCMAELKGVYQVKKGLYAIEKDWSNYSILSKLEDESIQSYSYINVPSYRLRQKTVETICSQFRSVNKNKVWKLLNDEEFLDSLGFNKENVFSVFIPGRYPLPDKLTERELIEAMHGEYELFWNYERKRKADKIDLSPEEVVVLASIVYSETKHEPEMPVIAGVYLNRLEKDMKLQSDPTLLYAAKKTGSKRVYFNDKNLDSKYNTYMYKGLPPGPIHVTPSHVIDAVLNYRKHSYLYFCAKNDFSGTHNFSETFEEHKQNANNYHKALNKANVF